MITCIIVDDEPHAIELIQLHLKKIADVQLVFSTSNPIEAFQYLQQHTADLIFLDIHMPELNGLQFLKLLNGKSKVILTTAYPEHALEGYEHDVVDYLLKPILFDRFLKAVTKAIALIGSSGKTAADPAVAPASSDYIFVKTETRGKLLKIKLADINYIEGLGNYAAIHSNEGKILCLITFKELETRLPAPDFIRVHKSFIIPVAKITVIEGNQLFINKQAIAIGESYKAALMELLGSKIVSKSRNSGE